VLESHVFAVEDGLEKQFEEVAKGRDDDACRQAAGACKANMQLPFVHCTPAAASRILYCNPVCFLSTMLPPPSSACPTFNVMALSWLAPANSHGGFVFCIKKSRASFAAILPGAVFGLSVATSEQAQLLLLVGSSSARQGSKLQRVPHITRCLFANAKAAAASAAAAAVPGNKRSRNAFAALAADSDEADDGSEQQPPLPADLALDPLFFISSSCAHVTCEVVRVTDAADAGHALVVAQVQLCVETTEPILRCKLPQILSQVTRAAVHPAYWRENGKVFGVPTGSAHPPPLSFVGSQRFAQVRCCV
jgi:flavin reductase (DIM6/NTAB) family NADH-FMN oxidoreductase RutF